MDKNKDSGRELHNARIFRAIRNIREGIKLKEKYGLALTPREKSIIGDKQMEV